LFLLPLFFLPGTSDVLDFNKQFLFSILIFLSLICWFFNSFGSKKLEINFSLLGFPIIILLLATGLSTVFSLSRYGSFWGWPLITSSSFLSLLDFIIFYFLIANLFKKEEIPFLFFSFFLSGFLICLFFIFQFYLSPRISLPAIFHQFNPFAKINSFNSIGTMNSLAIFLSCLVVLILPFFFFVKRFFKIILGIFGFLFLLTLFFINLKIAWLSLLIGSSMLVGLEMFHFQEDNQANFLPLFLIMIILGISLFFILFSFSLPGLPTISPETSPAQKTTIEIFRHLPIKSLILGTGPGTFSYVWSKYKPVSINQTNLWSTIFNQGPSEILDRLITTGILGVLSFFFLLYLAFKLNLSQFFKKQKQELDWNLNLIILAGFSNLLVAFFFYPANFSILFIFWFLISCLAILVSGEKKILSLTTLSIKSLAFSFSFILILVFGIGFSIFNFQRYFAELKYREGIKAWQQGNNVLSSEKLSEAIKLNPKIDLYYRDFAQIQFQRANEVLAKTDLKEEEKNNQLLSLINSVILATKNAIDLEPNNVLNWNKRGFIYRNLINLTAGKADEWALEAYQKSTELEPTNPFVWTEIGLIYLTRFDLNVQQNNEAEKEKNLKLAEENFQKAISLKSDYGPAHFQLAMISVKRGKIQEAIERLELIKQIAPFDKNLAFQLGVLYYNNNQFEAAKNEFERAVQLEQNYSNARYYLGLIYDRQGDKKKAIEQFEKIEQFNPDNQEVKKILTNLRAGKSAFEEVVPSQPSIQEKPAKELKK